MMADALPHTRYHGNSHRPPRPAVFAVGLLLGILVTAAADGAYTVLTSKPSAPGWNSTILTCTGRTGTGFFVRNNGVKDYRLADAREYTLMQSTGAGLVASDAKVHLPVFIPQGETAEIGMDGMPAGAIALFDLGRRCKVTLK
jgi:hypothetical protein